MKRLLALLVLLASSAGATDVTIKGNTYTLASHPRVLLDGPSGTITARVKDPDGAGAQVAPQATDANPSFVALKNLIDSCSASPTYCSSATERGTVVMAGALRWYMDNSQTDAKNMAIHWLNNVETWVANTFGFSCEITNLYCGVSSWSDWPSATMGELAIAYTLIRSEMSAGERTAFAQKMFNDDVAGYQDGCTNQLQQITTATAAFTSGSTAVSGTNLNLLSNGDRVYFRPSGGWATISTVNSAVSITLTGAPQLPLGGNAPTQTSTGLIFRQNAWDSSTCGLAWMLNHHAYAPRTAEMGFVLTTHTVSYTAVSSTITVSSVSGLPTPPFYINVPGTGETMKVTAINGLVLSVDRGQLLTSASASQFPPRNVYYSRYIPRVGSGEDGSNLVIQKTAGFFLMALALADDSAGAVSYAESHADYWIDEVYAQNLAMWTGVQQGGSTNYGNGRQLTMNHQIVVALKLINAALDKSGGTWLDNTADFYIMTALPNSTTTNMPWGQADLNQVASYASHIWAPLQINLFGSSSTQAAHWNYFQRNVANYYTSGNLTSGSNERMIPYLLLFQEEGFTSTDYRATKATAKAFNTTDGDGTRNLNAWVSRTGYTSSSDTLVFAEGWNLNWTQDHIGTGAPGAYRIYKGGYQLTSSCCSASSQTEMGVGSASNMPLFGGAANLKTLSQFLRVDLNRVAQDTEWAYARFNLVGAYNTTAAATRALRSLVHFKKASSPDYLVVYDDLATSAAKTLGINLLYDRAGTTPTAMTDGTVPSLVWTGSNRRLSTEIVIPSGSSLGSTSAVGAAAIRVTPCASSDGSTCANATSAEFLIVHKPSTSVNDVMPSVIALGTIDADFVGVQIDDATAPSVAVFAKAGVAQTTGSFTTTHSGTARYVISGIAPGNYDITRGVTTVLDDVAVDINGVITFTSVSGAFTIGAGSPPPPVVISTLTLPGCTEGQAYSAQACATGGTLPYVSWSNPGAGMPPHMTLTSGSPCATLGGICGNVGDSGDYTFSLTVTDSAAQQDSQEYTIPVAPTATSMAVTVNPGSNGAVVIFGDASVPSGSACTVSVETGGDPGEGSPVSSNEEVTRFARQRTTFRGLTPNSVYSVTASCPSVSVVGTATFNTRPLEAATAASVKLVLKPPSYLSTVTQVTVNYGISSTGENATTSSCASGCTITLSLVADIYQYNFQWKNSGGTVLQSSNTRELIVP